MFRAPKTEGHSWALARWMRGSGRPETLARVKKPENGSIFSIIRPKAPIFQGHKPCSFASNPIDCFNTWRKRYEGSSWQFPAVSSATGS